MTEADEPRLPRPEGWSPGQGEPAREPSAAEIEAVRGLGAVVLGAEGIGGGEAAIAGRAAPGSLALLIALALHASVLAVLLMPVRLGADPRIGAGGQVLDGVEIEVVSAEQLAARQAPRIAAAAVAAAGEIAPVAGVTEPAPPVEAVDPAGAAVKTVEAEGEARRELPKVVAGAVVVVPPDAAPASPDAPVLEVARQPEPKAGDDEAPVPDKAAPQATPEPVADPAQAQQAFRPPTADAPAEGGSVLPVPQHQEAHLTPAAAAPGEVLELGRRVQRALEKARPPPLGARGRVILEITVGTAGNLEAVSVLKSSGNPRLDEAALSAARRVAYPVPGPQFTRAQRMYHVPYRFQ